MDAYSSQAIYESNQYLKMDEEEEKIFSREETIKAFTKFIKEFQLGNTYVYR
jgi:hypothetical protein